MLGYTYEAAYGLTLIQTGGDEVMAKNLFRLYDGNDTSSPSSSSSSSSASTSSSSGTKHLCLLLGLPEDVTQQSFVQFLEPYIDEVANFALYSHYQYFDVDRLLFERFKPLVSAVVELKTAEAKESFVGVYNNLIAPSVASDGAAPLVALSLSWVVMHDDEQYLKEKELCRFEKRGYTHGEADHAQAHAHSHHTTPAPVALPTCGTCLSRVNGALSGIYDSEIDASLVSLRMYHSRKRCRTCLVGYEYLRSHQGPLAITATTATSPGVISPGINPIWRCRGSLDTTDSVLSHSVCGLNENIWVCLICSHTGCGRYSNQHAKAHYTDTGHAFTVELVTGRIWSYYEDTFVQVDGSLSRVFSGYRYMQESDEEEEEEEEEGGTDSRVGGGSNDNYNTNVQHGLHRHRGGAGAATTSDALGGTDSSANTSSNSSSKSKSRSRARPPRTVDYRPDYYRSPRAAPHTGLSGGGGGGGGVGGLSSSSGRDDLSGSSGNYYQRGGSGNSGHYSPRGFSSPGDPPTVTKPTRHQSLTTAAWADELQQDGSAETSGAGAGAGWYGSFPYHRGSSSSSSNAGASPFFTSASPRFSESSAVAAGAGSAASSLSPSLSSSLSRAERPVLEPRTYAKLDAVKAEYEMLQDSRLHQQELHLQKMLAQEMARALHERFEGEGNSANSSISRDNTMDQALKTAASEEWRGGGVMMLPQHYLTDEVEADLHAIEACKIEISLQEQQLLLYEQQHYEVSRLTERRKRENNEAVTRVKALKEEEASLRGKEAQVQAESQQQEQELRSTISDLRFYLRSRNTLASLTEAGEGVSQSEVRTGSVEVVVAAPAPAPRGGNRRNNRRVP